MAKVAFCSKPCRFLLLVLFSVFSSAFQTIPKKLDNIVLADEHLSINLKEYYIENVTDELEDHGPAASLIAQTKGSQPLEYTADLKGGTVSAVKQFITTNLPQNTAPRPIIIGLKKINIKETAQANNRVEGNVKVIFSFYLDKGDEDKIRLGDYSGSAVYNRDAGQTQYIEPALRKVLVNGLVYLNTWMELQAPINIKLAKAVKLTFTDYKEKSESDSIYYSVARPLTWADFSGKIPTSKYSAEVFPNLGYDEHTEINNGVINAHIALKVSLPKSAAWVKDGNRSDYTLNHEQRHFDIVKIAAGHFKQKLTAMHLLPDNYEGVINMEYLDAYREMNDLQKQYDNATNHGINTTEQESWNAKIDKELKELGVK